MFENETKAEVVKPLISEIPDEAYFALPAISKSQLKHWDDNHPMAFWRQCMLNPERKADEVSDALVMGKLRHTMLLEPHKIENDFVVIEGGRGFSSRSTEAFKKEIATHAQKNPITKDELETATLQIKTLLEYQKTRDILKDLLIEKPFTWTETGILCKSKLDGIKNLKNNKLMVFEYKTTGTMDAVARSIDGKDWQYDVGMAALACQAKYGKYPDIFSFLVQSQKEGAEHNIRNFVVEKDEIENYARYVSVIIAKVAKRYKEYLDGKKSAWHSPLYTEKWDGYAGAAHSFSFEKKLENLTEEK
jgi:hypothetical protein